MVSQFRDFLNTSPRFEELRESVPYRPGGARIRGAAARRSQAMANYLNAAEGDGFDDEMADEENDFEGMDGSDMAIDAQTQNPNTGSDEAMALPPVTQSIPVPPPAPDISQHPFASSSNTHPAFQSHQHQQAASMGPLGFSSFMSNEPATGNPPLSAHGHVQASIATLSPHQNANHGGSSSSSLVNGASAATMHQQAHQDEE